MSGSSCVPSTCEWEARICSTSVDPVRYYTVEPGKTLAGTWNVSSSYSVSVYGLNGFVRYFNGSIGSNAAALDVRSRPGLPLIRIVVG
jgi:phospholipase C